MQKKILSCILGLMLITGCTRRNETDPGKEAYETYWHAVEDNVKYTDSSVHFHYSTEMTQLPDGTYRYYIVIDEPQHAMYQCVVLAVEDDATYSSAGRMMPSMGIFDDPVSMIPNQVNTEGGFVKGLVLSGESSAASVNIRMLVEWKDRTGKTTTREFLSFPIPASEAQTEVPEGETPAEGEGGA